MVVAFGYIHMMSYFAKILKTFVAVIERNINRRIRPVRNRELLHDLLRLLVFRVD